MATIQVFHPPTSPSLEKDSIEVTVASASPETTNAYLLQQSPYEEAEHLLDLTTLSLENALLARALAKMRNIRDDYAIAPYQESFNWDEIIAELRSLAVEEGGVFRETSFYVVAFRSQIKGETDYSVLGDLDKPAHAEAIASGGFLKYWFGSPDAELRNLATCVWRSREDAIAGGKGPAHRRAAGSTRALYAYWKIDQLKLTIKEGVEGFEIGVWE